MTTHRAYSLQSPYVVIHRTAPRLDSSLSCRVNLESLISKRFDWNFFKPPEPPFEIYAHNFFWGTEYYVPRYAIVLLTELYIILFGPFEFMRLTILNQFRPPKQTRLKKGNLKERMG